MSATETVIYVQPLWPPGVVKIIGTGFDYYIGLCADNTVLKYLHTPSNPDIGARQSLDVEAQIYKVLGNHPRILGFLGGNCHNGIYLEYAENGSLATYLAEHDASTSQRLEWALQATEGLAHVHSKNVLHRDISTSNLLLDKDLNLKLADFQGRYVLHDGTLLDGLACEGVKSAMPRPDMDIANELTDIFGLGSAIYYIMENHEPFVELDTYKDELEIKLRFQLRQFPPLNPHRAGHIIQKCWESEYKSAQEVVSDLKELVHN